MRSSCCAWLLLLAVGACSQPAGLRLRLGAMPAVGELDAVALAVRVGGDLDAAVSRPDAWELDGRDLALQPAEVEMEVAEGSEFGALARVVVWGLNNGQPVASAVALADLSQDQTITLILAPIGAGCDQDRDGLKDCSGQPACCTEAEKQGFADCDDARAQAHPFAASAECRACQPSCGVGEGQPEVAEGVEQVEVSDAAEPSEGGPLEEPGEPEASEILEPAELLELPSEPEPEPAPEVADQQESLPEAEAQPDVPEVDAETSCECASGPCCDGCHFRPASFECESHAETTYSCVAGCGGDVMAGRWDRYCPGDAASCSGQLVGDGYELHQDCQAWESCFGTGPEYECHYEATCAEDLCPLNMVLVPPGPFYMGCNAYVTGGCDADQYPQHLVDTPVYCIDTFEVSRWDYSQCVGSGCVAAASGTNCNGDQPDKDQHPINCVTWDQARTYCEARGARLCSEAEWEKAARGGCELLAGDCAPSMLTFPWGNDCPQAWGGTCAGEGWDAGTAKANCAKSLCQDDYEFTAPVDAFSADPSPYLLVAMAGNVMEWVEDCNHDSYDPDGDGQVDAPTDGQAWVDGCSSTGRVVRGGNWNSAVAAALAASDRGAVNPGSAVSGIGFRCCKDFLP